MIEVSDQGTRRTINEVVRQDATGIYAGFYGNESEEEDNGLDQDEDSENLVMAAKLLEEAAAWFPAPSSNVVSALGRPANENDLSSDYWRHMDMFYPGECIHVLVPS